MSATPRPPIPSLIPEVGAVHAGAARLAQRSFCWPVRTAGNVTPVSDADAAKLLAGLLDGAVAPAAGRR